ncbi:MAG: UTP--glucose-1-phosphate uridylyltransferase GalU [Phycisphaerae bacterium]|nr:UTP--glucose-1-phosphate uridylyltransferase GalU [Phycisphaerae bacterium]NIP52957.1 UTP--glucose-1-phosphate uridylyltransferase GalU [Phycisphaerae bacterium]NIS52008.1 UTP--glucose-1-phosphate uridylyltransferase GalU [Phycisphaerae bacterium]NIU09522.1 UTP--glucose-1-phosphate uridylyltransferase GalU [Phycisphaerae bacterium]NIU58173.1 UTP--glucose-1-phosphate uridylyltransferase GalU [Phycisphaerae bacterium]
MIHKAVIPAAGFGTRFLPATKSQPKEMLPIVDTPVIQYVVEEAVEAGITDILMIIGKGKRAIEEHFDRSFQLENQLHQKNKKAELAAIRRISELADIHFVWQREMKGLGDAIYCARHHVQDEPFVVLLGDTLIDSAEPAAGQLQQLFEQRKEPVVLVEEVDRSRVSRYGVIDAEQVETNVWLVNNIIEKPTAQQAPSNLAIAGRYLFTPDIFEYISRTKPVENGEIQLTDSMRMMIKDKPMYALVLDGKRCDIGNKEGFIKTNIEFALKRKDMAEELRQFIKELAEKI